MPAWKCAVYARFRGSKPGFHFFARPKEKVASNQAHFPLETHCNPINRLPTGLKCAALFLEVSPPYAT